MQMSITDKVKDQTYSLCLMGWVWRVREIHGLAYSFLPWCVMMVSGGWSGGGERGEVGERQKVTSRNMTELSKCMTLKYS